MKKIITILALSFIYCISFSQDIKVLFIGNSHTSSYDLPTVFNDFASAGGKHVVVSSALMGGSTLQDHFNSPTTISKIYSDDWDYVILQEQSQIPSWEDDRETMMYPYAYKLDSIIHDNNSCTQTVFFMTWAHKPGDLEILYNGGSDTFEDMQQRLYDGYMEIADSLEAIVAPVGWVWKEVIQTDNTIELYRTDEYHPVFKGTYLAACTFYSTIFREDATIPYYDTLDVEIAQFLQTKASSIVMDDLELWNIGIFDPTPLSGYYYDIQGTEYLFTDTSIDATSYLWDFGDGTTSTLQNPTHTFSENGIHQIRQIAYNDCGSDTSYQNIDVITSIDIESNIFRIFPNPSTGLFTIEGNDIQNIEIIDMTGKIICKQIAKSEAKNQTLTQQSHFVDLSNKPKGIYFLKIETTKGSFMKKVIVQ